MQCAEYGAGYRDGIDGKELAASALFGGGLGAGIGAIGAATSQTKLGQKIAMSSQEGTEKLNRKIASFEKAVDSGVKKLLTSSTTSGQRCPNRGCITLPGKKGGSKYVKASFWERIRTKTAPIGDINPNPLDEFSNPKIGPNESAVSRYIKDINTNGTISEPIEVQKLTSGGYEIVNGHHRWLAAIKTGLKDIPIKIVNYEN